MNCKAALSPEILAQFSHLLGPKGFTVDGDDIAPWLRDWRGLYHGQAAAMLSPASVEEVQAVVALAHANRIPLVPQGGNTSMVGGATPSEDGSSLILSTRRLNTVRAIDPAEGIAVVEAGVILETLHENALATRMRFPLTLGAKGSATIGGLVSCNAGGTQVLRFGTMRNLVLGLEAVLPDGSRWDGLVPLKKDNRGYDLNQLLIGAEGTLGVVTAAALRLVAATHDRSVAWIGVESPEQALSLLRAMERETGDAVESFEVIPADCLALVLAHIPGTRSPLAGAHPWHVLVEYVQSSVQDQTAAEALTGVITDMLGAGLAQDAVIAANEAQAEAFWRLRDSISEAERAEGPTIAHDISVAVAHMPAFMIEAAAKVKAAFPGVGVSAFGHLGDGNVHFHVRAPVGVDAARWRAEVGGPASHLVYDLVTAAQGSLSAEHGIGQMKLAELVRQSDPIRITMLRAIKNALDPHGIMNPGKLVPLAPERRAP